MVTVTNNERFLKKNVEIAYAGEMDVAEVLSCTSCGDVLVAVLMLWIRLIRSQRSHLTPRLLDREQIVGH